MFSWRAELGHVDIAITDRSVDLLDPDGVDSVRSAMRLEAVASMRQVHGADVAWASDARTTPMADVLATDVRGLGVLVRVADCVPVALVAPDAGLAAAVHVGRRGLVAGVVPAAATALRARGADRLEAWIGPHICGRCYELPPEMVDVVADVVPEARSVTSWHSPAADLGAGVRAQLEAFDTTIHEASVCTLEDDRFFSHRRGDDGRFGVVAVLR